MRRNNPPAQGRHDVLHVLAIIFFLTFNACSGCREPEPVQIEGQSLALQARSQPQPGSLQSSGPRVIEIKARPYTGEKTGSTPASEAAISIGTPTPAANTPKITQAPPGSIEEEGLTRRLMDKLKESNIPFNDKNPPKIYTSNQSISEFSSYYESRGQRVSRMSIPAAVLIRPLLQDHPELATKVDIDALDKVTINQVVVEGTGISAADKYIDPDTLQVVDKLFVTDMPSDLGK
jgi:hypothetical protein